MCEWCTVDVGELLVDVLVVHGLPPVAQLVGIADRGRQRQEVTPHLHHNRT
jgi:hypothetical protein